MEQTANERATQQCAALIEGLDGFCNSLDWLPDLPFDIEVSLSGRSGQELSIQVRFRVPFGRKAMESNVELLAQSDWHMIHQPDEPLAASLGFQYQLFYKDTRSFEIYYDPKLPGSICHIRKVGERVEQIENKVNVYEFACE